MPPSAKFAAKRSASRQEHVQFWRDPALQNLEVLQARYITHAFSRHTHEGYAIGVIEAGVETFSYRGSQHRAAAGSLVIIHPGEVHTGQAGAPDGWVYRMLYPEVALVQSVLAENSAIAVPYFQPILRDAALVKQFRALHQTLGQSDSPLERESQFLAFIASLVRRYGDTQIGDRAFRSQLDQALIPRVQRYLNDHIAQRVSLAELAQISGLPPLKLLRLFRQATGLPPHAYLIQLRVNQAKRLLAAGLPLVQVALDTGFADQSHLHRHFKRLVGVTPGQYAQGATQSR
jgi:AraC-like DNA-binding protein